MDFNPIPPRVPDLFELRHVDRVERARGDRDRDDPRGKRRPARQTSDDGDVYEPSSGRPEEEKA